MASYLMQRQAIAARVRSDGKHAKFRLQADIDDASGNSYRNCSAALHLPEPTRAPSAIGAVLSLAVKGQEWQLASGSLSSIPLARADAYNTNYWRGAQPWREGT